MSKLDNFVSRLKKLKRTGKDSWIACCPSHPDKSPSLAIREVETDKILVKCFAGCSIEEITGSIGLTLGDIMPDTAPDSFRKPYSVPFNPRDVLACLRTDAMLLSVFISDVTQGNEITPQDAANAFKASCRIIAACEIGGGAS